MISRTFFDVIRVDKRFIVRIDKNSGNVTGNVTDSI